jgi:hypothetical protein
MTLCGKRSPLTRNSRPAASAVLLRCDNGSRPLAWQVLEGVGLEQSLVELAPLTRVHLGQRRVADDLADAAAQRDARHWRRVEGAGYSPGDAASD